MPGGDVAVGEHAADEPRERGRSRHRSVPGDVFSNAHRLSLRLLQRGRLGGELSLGVGQLAADGVEVAGPGPELVVAFRELFLELGRSQAEPADFELERLLLFGGDADRVRVRFLGVIRAALSLTQLRGDRGGLGGERGDLILVPGGLC